MVLKKNGKSKAAPKRAPADDDEDDDEFIEGIDSGALKRGSGPRPDLLPFGPQGEERVHVLSLTKKKGFKGEQVRLRFKVLTTTRQAEVKKGGTYVIILKMSGEGDFNNPGSGPRYFAGRDFVAIIAAMCRIEKVKKRVRNSQTGEVEEIFAYPKEFRVGAEAKAMAAKGESLADDDYTILIKTAKRLGFEGKGKKRKPLMNAETGKQSVFFDRYYEIDPGADEVEEEEEEEEDDEE